MPEIYRDRSIQELELSEKWRLFKSFFNYCRDIPFSCKKSPNRPKDLDGLLANLIIQGRGQCTAKHFLLGQYCDQLGYNVNYLSCRFHWQEQPIDYPTDLKNLVDDMPEQLHTAITVDVGDGIIRLMDCTWDKFLQGKGFVVNELFDQPSECMLGLIPCSDPVFHTTKQSKWGYLSELKQSMPSSEIVPTFYNQFDVWLDQVRGSFSQCNK